MKILKKSLLAAAVGSAAFSATTLAEEPTSITEALKMGSTKLHLRARVESASEDGTDDALATTLKTRLTYTSADYRGFGLTLEMDDTTAFLDDDFNSGVNGKDEYAKIIDPEGTEVNQAFVSYKSGGTTFKYGRQRILLDNQRFVGGVGWRQDEQTYDAFSVSSKPTENVELFVAYVMDVNRIVAQTQDHDHETALLNASYNFGFGKLIGYGYLIDNITSPELSSDTYGARWQGKAGDVISYNLEYATQSEGGDNPTEYSADYMLAEVAGDIPMGESKLSLKLGYEVLGADEDAGTAFKTTLATLHAFQGWADKFLETPAGGIEDIYFSAGSKLGPVKVMGVYHSYSADVGDADYGSEFGLVVSGKAGPVGLTFKLSDYSADDHAADTQKIWLMAAATF